MRGLAAARVRVPHDVSVIGFDDIFGAELCSPSLTTVAAPLQSLGRYAVQTLLAGMRSRTPPDVRPALLPAQLVVRESTSRRGRRRKA